MIRCLKAHHWIGHFHQIPTRGRWFEQALGKIHNPTTFGNFCCGKLTLLVTKVVPKRCCLTLKGRRVMMQVSVKSTLPSPFLSLSTCRVILYWMFSALSLPSHLFKFHNSLKEQQMKQVANAPNINQFENINKNIKISKVQNMDKRP